MCAVLGAAACMMLDQQFVYFPAPWQHEDWAARSGLPLEDVWLTASDGVRLHGWYVQGPAEAPVILWFHGNAGNIIHRLENLALLHRRGVSVFILDYRGYGRSSGRPSEEGLYRDAEAAYVHLTGVRAVPAGRIVIFGRSLGASVAGELAARHPDVAALILETPFPSVAAVAKVLYGMPVHHLLRARYELDRQLPKVRVPILVIHGDRDQVIPMELGRRVFEAAPEPKRWYTIPGADHNDTYVVGGQAYFDAFVGFVNEAVRRGAPEHPGS